MSVVEAILIGLLQGITEFLPVSSSGHLVVFQDIMGIDQPGVTLEVVVHFGTFFSITWVFRADVIKLVGGFFTERLQRKYFLLLFAGTLPTAAAGLLAAPLVKAVFEETVFVGFMLLLTGLFNWIIYRVSLREEKGKDVASMNIIDAVLTGMFQALAVMPGISRSGSTLLGALSRGLTRETALRYSFLLALPAISGAALFELGEWLEAGGRPENIYPLGVAAVTAFFSGILAIKLFIAYLKHGRFYYFSYYCWLAGILTIIYTFFIST